MKLPEDPTTTAYVWTGANARPFMTEEQVAREAAGTATVDDFPAVVVSERGGWATDGKGRLVKRWRSPNALVVVVRNDDLKTPRFGSDSKAVARHADLHERDGFVPPPVKTKPERADTASAKRASAEKIAARLAKETGLPFAAVLTGGDWFVQLNPRSPACVAFRDQAS